MAPKTLYDIVRPICWRLNMFGYNYGNEQPAGWMRRGYKMAVKCFLLYLMWRKMLFDCMSPSEYSITSLIYFIWDSLIISSFCLQLFFVKEGEMENMITKMKQYPIRKMSQKSLHKQLIPSRFFLTIFTYLFRFITLFGLAFAIGNFIGGTLPFSKAVFMAVVGAYCGLIFNFPALVCLLPCIVACFCRTEMDEAMEEMKRIKSPLRRAKAGAKLMEKYQQLYELASVTDVGLSTAMYFMKWILFIAFAAVILADTIFINDTAVTYQNKTPISIVDYLEILFLNSLILVYFPLFQYFYLAPSANQMFDQMNRAIVDCSSIDDQWLSPDPISRPYLLKMRMEQVELVSHMATEDPPFTLFGDVLDNDISYAVFLELIDMCNTLGAHQVQDEMIPTRIFRTFMKRCIDCDFWIEHMTLD